VNAPLNLAREPFRNERLPTLLLAAGLVLLAGATLRQAQLAYELLPGRSGDSSSELAQLEAETRRLRAEADSLSDLAAAPDVVAEWAAVKTLVDRRAFSWTGLFAALEEALPPGVRLLGVQPTDSASGTELELSAQGHGSEDALALLQALQSHPEFDGAFLNGWSEARDGVSISCTVSYRPKAGPR
jgi:Tfp pilus assembly protein PilN